MAISLAIASAKKGLNNNKTYHKTNCSFTASLFSPGEIDFRWLRRQPFHRLSECYHSARCFLTDRSIVRFSSPLDHQGTDGRPNKNQTAFQSTAYLPASLALFCCIAFAFAFSSCSFALLRPAQEKKTLIKIPLSISVSTFRAALAARSRSFPVQEVCDRSTSLCHKREKKAFIRMMKMMMALPRALDACARCVVSLLLATASAVVGPFVPWTSSSSVHTQHFHRDNLGGREGTSRPNSRLISAD